MLNTIDVLNAINKKLVEAYPDRAVYIDRLPEGFERPSFFIEFVTANIESKNYNTVNVTQYYEITGFETKDRDYNSDTLDLLTNQSIVIDLFRSGRIEIDGRSIEVSASASGRDEDVFYIDIQTEFFDIKGMPKGNYPTMTEVEVKNKINKEG